VTPVSALSGTVALTEAPLHGQERQVVSAVHTRKPAADGAAPTVGAPRKYASALMADRKDRILSEAQQLLDEKGVKGFTIRELSRRADVAQRTLYNVFGSKEDIIVSAIERYHATLDMPSNAPPDDIEQELEVIAAAARVVISLRRYATAMVDVFFSPTVDRRIYESLRRISLSGANHWIELAGTDKVLVKMSEPERDRLRALLVNVTYANITDWAASRISDAELVLRWQINFLIIIRNYLRPAQRKVADAALARLSAAT
jgi:TetR/AcrR family transcriptional repressor of uid operon